MKQKVPVEVTSRVEMALPYMFFTQGFLSLAIVPRVPELIRQLQLDAAGWGLVVGVSGAMGMFAMFFGSKLVRRFATRPLMLATSVIFCLAVSSYGFLRSGSEFLLAASVFSISMSLFNLCLNTHAVSFQKIVKRVIIGKFHAWWSIGATMTTLIGGILANYLSLQLHLVVISGLSCFVFWFFGRKILPPEYDGHSEKKTEGKPANYFKSPKLLWLLAAGNITGVMCEAMLIDWSSVFTQEFMRLPLTISTIPYTVFGLAMILGRLSISHFAKQRHFSELARIGGLFGSLALGLSVFLGPPVAQISPIGGMLVMAFFWAIAGLGVAPMMPSFASATGSVPNLDTTQVMARMSLTTSILMMGAKILMGGLVSAVTLQYAFLFVVASFFTASLISGKVAKNLNASEITPNAFPPTEPIAALD